MWARLAVTVALFSLGWGSLGWGAWAQGATSPEASPPFFRLVILQDWTGSRAENVVPILSTKDLESFLKELAYVPWMAVDIRFGLILDRPKEGLLRLAWKPFPPKPDNLLQRPRWEKIWQEQREHRLKLIPDFLKETQASLKREKPALKSDVCGALNQAFLALREEYGYHGYKDAGRILLALTDGGHNVKQSVCPKGVGGIRVLVVNSLGKVGVLSDYKPTCFENPGRALAHIRQLIIQQIRMGASKVNSQGRGCLG